MCFKKGLSKSLQNHKKRIISGSTITVLDTMRFILYHLLDLRLLLNFYPTLSNLDFFVSNVNHNLF